MKNLFAFEATDVVASRRYAGEEFVVRRVDSPLAAKQAEFFEQSKKIQKGANFPKWLNLVVTVVMLLSISVVAAALSAWADGDVPYETQVENGLWYFIGIGGGVFLLTLPYFLIQSIRRRRVMASSEVVDYMERVKKLSKECLASLSVPENSVGVDIFISPIVRRFGKNVSAFGSAYLNENFFVYRDGDALCIADEACVVRIPFEKIVKVSCVMRRVGFWGWNKEEAPAKGQYKPFKIRANESGGMSVKPFYCVEIMGTEPLALLFPPYEFEAISPLLGSKAFMVEEAKKVDVRYV